MKQQEANQSTCTNSMQQQEALSESLASEASSSCAFERRDWQLSEEEQQQQQHTHEIADQFEVCLQRHSLLTGFGMQVAAYCGYVHSSTSEIYSLTMYTLLMSLSPVFLLFASFLFYLFIFALFLNTEHDDVVFCVVLCPYASCHDIYMLYAHCNVELSPIYFTSFFCIYLLIYAE